MKKITLISLLVFYSFITYGQNSCSNALSVYAGSTTVNSINGTDPALPNCLSNVDASLAEWYKYLPNNDYTITISTDLSQNGNTDTRFHVFTGSCGNLTCFAGDDDGGSVYYNYASVDQFNVVANTVYYIAFDNRYTSNGFDFELTESTINHNAVTFTSQSISNLGSPYMITDMNGDFLDDVVTTNTNSVNINYQKANGTFDNVVTNTTAATNTASWSTAAGDLDGNGYMDLLYGGGGGATFMYANVSETSNPSNAYATNYTQYSPSIYIFSQRTNFIDINNDGLLDAFVCHDVNSNVYFINDGNGGLVTHQVGDGNSVDLGALGRNYATLWVDYDNDQDADVFISKCGGDSQSTKNRLYQNNGDGTFTDVSIVSGLNSSIQTWSSAWDDFDNDGFMDVLVGASYGANEFMRNNGDGTFSNITAGSGFDTFTDTSVEYLAKDFNNDGFVDVLASGYVMINNGNMTFTRSIHPVGVGAVGDVNNDGFIDVFSNGNLKINEGIVGKWLKVNLTGVQSNLDGIGARIEVTSTLGTQIRDVRSGVGFRHMSSLTAHFGLGEDSAIDNVTVYWPSGNIDSIDNPSIDATINIIENSAPLSINENLISSISLYPNPTTNELTIKSQNSLENSIIAIFDIQGKKVYNSFYNSDKINVANLEQGIYFLRIIHENKTIKLKFIKH
ncbi:MAG: FG-GAP-like repeat-containing protein [Flavobacteriaceae bacterium]